MTKILIIILLSAGLVPLCAPLSVLNKASIRNDRKVERTSHLAENKTRRFIARQITAVKPEDGCGRTVAVFVDQEGSPGAVYHFGYSSRSAISQASTLTIPNAEQTQNSKSSPIVSTIPTSHKSSRQSFTINTVSTLARHGNPGATTFSPKPHISTEGKQCKSKREATNNVDERDGQPREESITTAFPIHNGLENPRNLDQQVHCRWILAGKNKDPTSNNTHRVIWIENLLVGFPHGSSCVNRYMRIYDGKDATAPLLKSLCQFTSLPDRFYTTQSYLFIQFIQFSDSDLVDPFQHELFQYPGVSFDYGWQSVANK